MSMNYFYSKNRKEKQLKHKFKSRVWWTKAKLAA